MINFIIHPGFVKTGSTFFQKNIIPNLENTLNLGKPYKSSNVLQENIKNLFYKKSNKKKKLLLIDDISQVILTSIKVNKLNTIVFSDEAFLDAEFYDPKKNIYYLNILIKKLKKKEKINIKFVLTIRAQLNLIISRFAFVYPNIKVANPTLTDYINNNIKNKSFFFNSLKFLEFKKYIQKKINCKFYFIPLETLENNKKRYLQSIKKIFLQNIRINKIKFLKINTNSKNSIFYIKKGNNWFHLYLIIRNIKFLLPIKFTSIFKKFFSKKIKFDKSEILIKHNKYTTDRIYKYYNKDNKSLLKKFKINYL